jgi:hydrogenase maturation protease
MTKLDAGRSRGQTRVVVIGIGNPFRGDDAVGVVFSRRIRDSVPRGVTVLEHDGESARLMEAWAGADMVYLVDAAHANAEGGKIFRFEAHRERLPAELFGLSTHAFGVAEAIELARNLDELPVGMIVYGVQGKRFDHTSDLSPEVDGACDAVVSQVLDEIRRTLNLEAGE